MKLLLFSDVHCSEEHCRKLVEKSHKADAVVGAGDLGLVRKGLNKTIALLRVIEKPTILVPGNSESYEELDRAARDWKQAVVLHGTGIQLLDTAFYGVGGGIPVTPFGDWSYDFTEEEARELLAGCPDNGILITHSPPRGAVDLSSSGQRFGSQAIRKIIQERKPRLCVCGHIHESAGSQDVMGDTVVINAGPEGILWEL